MVEMRVQGRERGMEVWYGRDEGTGEGEGDGGWHDIFISL